MRTLLLCSFLLLVAAVGASWWLLASGDESLGRAGELQSIGVGGSPSADPSALADPGQLTAIPAGAGTPLKVTQPVRPEQAAARGVWTTTGIPPLASRTFNGRVLTPEGKPQAGVAVAWLPGPEVLLAAGLVVLNRDAEEPPNRFLDVLWPSLSVTHTDDEGRFTLNVEEAEIREGQRGRSPGPVLVARSAVALNFLAPVADELGDIVLCSDGSLSVDVVDEDGWAMPGAWAEFDLDSSTDSACAGDWEPGRALSAGDASFGIVVSLHSGVGTRFVSDTLPRGAGLLRAGAPGYGTVSRYLLEKNLAKEQPPFVLQPVGSYAGRVLTEHGQPQVGALVTITSTPATRNSGHHSSRFKAGDDTLLLALEGAYSSGPARAPKDSSRRPLKNLSRRTLTDDNGRFVFKEMPLRLHDVFVQAEGQQPLRERDIVPNGPVVELRLRAAVQLSVDVRDQTGRPVEHALVEAWRGFGGKPNRLLVDFRAELDGPFVVRNVSEIVTTVQVSAPLHGKVIERAQGGQESLAIVLPPAGAVEVLVMRGGLPLQGTRIACTFREDAAGSTKAYLSRTTGSDGRVRFDHLSRGVLTIDPSSWYGRAYSSLDMSESLDVAVKPGELVTVVLGSQAKAVVTGQVAGVGGGVWVVMERDGEAVAKITTRGEGAFTLSAPAGSYQVLVSGEVVAHLDLAPGEQRRVVLPSPRGARIEGRLTSGGQPVSGWTVNAIGMAQVPPQVVTDELGRFVLALPGAGQWTPRLFMGSWRSRPGPDLLPVDIEPGGVALLDIELPASSISVRVITGKGTGVTDVGITFRRVDDGASQAAASGVRAHADEHGMVRAQWLEAGTWAVEMSGGWGWVGVASEPFELLEGAAYVHPDLLVQRACQVRGQAWATPGVLVGGGVQVLFIDEEGRRESIRLDSDGSFYASSLAPGLWQVVLAETRYTDPPVDVPSGVGQLLHLSSGQEVTTELVMLPLR